MTIYIKTKKEIKKMRIVGRLSAEVLEMIEPYVTPNISTGELDSICSNFIVNKQNAISACLGYYGFPKSVCTSVNEVVCHGIPDNKKLLKDGDIINIDVAIIKDGYYGDSSKMFFVGRPSFLAKNLCHVTQQSLYLALKTIKPGVRLRVLGKKIENFIKNKGFSIVREYCGHGIGCKFHEEPQILHYDANDNGITLQEGMAFTIEPMINSGEHGVYTMKDGWTVKTKDNSLSAQYEHTVVVTKKGCEIMTLRKDDTIPSLLLNNK